MRKPTHSAHVVGVVLLLLLAACKDTSYIDTEKVVAENVQEQLDEYKRVSDRRCLDNILTEAGKIADSIILVRARTMKDTLLRPDRPTRPEKPIILSLEDSLALAPFIQQ